MKVLLKEKLLQMASSLEEANAFFAAQPGGASAGQLLADCQEAAMRMGGLIEVSEEQPGPVIAKLEEYCELVYQLSICSDSDWHRCVEALAWQVAAIRRTIEEDIASEKMKAVFLPYSASMWDSFDSVYAQAAADPRFDVKVIPIPYYSLGVDGRPLRVCYEGAEVAKYAPVTDYKEYSFPVEQPDVVFIHNPYDGCNRVTRVFEQFFSSELVKYTQRLVYIPYYISKDRTMPHFAQMPGVQNAWRVFVQNELARKQYTDSGIAPEKVIALGSPKLDMVVRTSQEMRQLPEEWQILKGRKIFFYNTALVEILDHGEYFLEKVRYVLHTFEKHPDLALLWRPHPLSIPTMQSMTPGLLEEYLRIVEQFKKSGLGVYDETGELERTIAVSDAYIGDIGSSVSQLYEATGKPMFYVQYHDPNFALPQRWVRATCGEAVGQKLYLFNWEYNGLFIYDEAQKTLYAEVGSGDTPVIEKNLFNFAEKIGDAIYFFPDRNRSVLKYDIATGAKTYFDMGSGEHGRNAVYKGGKIYFFPIWYHEHIKTLDVKTGKIELIPTNYENQFPELHAQRANIQQLFFGDAVVGDAVWRTCYLGHFLQKFVFSENKFVYAAIEGLHEPLRKITSDGRFLWCTALQGSNVYQLDPEKQKVVQIFHVEGERCLKDAKVFEHIFFFENGIWVVLREEYRIVRIDPRTGKIAELDFSHLFGRKCGKQGQILFANAIKAAGGIFYLLPYHADGIVKVDAEAMTASRLKIPVDETQRMNLTAENVVVESMQTLEEFLNRFPDRSAHRVQEAESTAGSQIWDFIVKDFFQ